MRLVPLMILAFFSGACERLDNAISELALDCGSGLQASSYVKILDPQGQELKGADILAWQMLSDGSRQEQGLSSKGCLSTERLAEGPFVVSTSLGDRTWGAVIQRQSLPFLREVRLKNREASEVRAKCSAPIHSRGKIENPVLWPEEDKDAFPLRFAVLQKGQEIPLDASLVHDDEILLPTQLKDGPLDLRISYSNLFRRDRERKQEELSCSYVLDRDVPRISDSFKRTLTSGLFRVEPGETISLRAEDDHAAHIHSCLRRMDEKSCETMDAFETLGAEAVIQAPDSGRWCLEVIAEDKAGNLSPKTTTCFIAYQSSKIESIRALADNAFNLVDEDQLAATVSIIKALTYYFSLTTDEERAAAEDKLFNSAMSVASRVFERFRFISDDIIRVLEAVDQDGHFLEANNAGVHLWDAKGKRLDSFPFAYGYHLHVQARKALLASSKELTVLDLGQLRFEKLSFDLLPDGFEITAARWNPGADEFIVAGRDPASDYPSLLVYRRSDAGYRLAQNLDISSGVAAEEMKWSPGSRYLALASPDAILILENRPDGTYAPVGTQAEALREGGNRGLAFLAMESHPQLIFMRDSGALSSWTAENGFADLESDDEGATKRPPSIEDLSRGRLRTILERDPNSVFLLRGSQLELLTLKAGSILKSNLPLSGYGDPRRIVDWKMSVDGRFLSIAVLASDSFAYAVTAPRDAKDWAAYPVLSSARFPFEKVLPLSGDVTVTSDSARQIRFWTMSSLNPSFRASIHATPFLKWINRDGRDELITAGYEGVARFWSLLGEKRGEFKHWDAVPRQINDVVWNDRKDRFATVAEDGRTVIWTAEGQRLAVLDDDPGSSISPAFWRGAAVFAKDQTTIVTGGDKTFAIWKKKTDSEDYSLVANILQGSSTSHAKPGDLRILSIKGEEIILASRPDAGRTTFAFYTTGGEAVDPLAAYAVGRVRRLALNGDGSLLAVAEEGKGLRIFRNSGEGFALAAEFRGGLSSRALLQLQWSPDSRTVAAVFAQEKITAWAFDGQVLRLKAERKLANGVDPGLLHWFPDSQKLVYAERNSILVFDSALEERARIQPFGSNEKPLSLAPSPSGRYLAAAQDGIVTMIDLARDKGRLAERCQEFVTFLRESNVFDHSDFLSPSDRDLCQAAHYPAE